MLRGMAEPQVEGAPVTPTNQEHPWSITEVENKVELCLNRYTFEGLLLPQYSQPRLTTQEVVEFEFEYLNPGSLAASSTKVKSLHLFI